MKNGKFLVIVLAIFWGIFNCPLELQAGAVLDLGDPIGGPPDVPQRLSLEYFCSEVAKRSNGEITIKYHPQTIVSSEFKAVEMCKAGALAFCTMGGSTGTIFPNVQVLELPYIIRDHLQYYNIVRGPIGKEMEEEILKKHNLKLIFWFDWGFRQFINNKRPINKPEDLQGLKLRIIQSIPLRDIVNALGASPVPISWAETIPAIQQGVVDGLDLAFSPIIKYKVYEVVKFGAITKHLFTPSPLLANISVWNSFSPDQKRIILQVGKEAADKNWELVERADVDGKGILEKLGMQITTPDLTPFRKIAMEKVYQKYYDKFSKAYLDRIQSVK